MKQFPNEFYVDHKFLMCISCEKAIDHLRKSNVIQHMKTEKHLQQKAKRQRQLDAIKVGNS